MTEDKRKELSQSSPSRAHENSGPRKKSYRPKVQKEIVYVSFGELIDCPDTVSDRVDYIADIMSEMRWERGKSGKLIAKKWGLSLSTIEHYASEASRKIVVDRDTAMRVLTDGAMKLFQKSIVNEDAKSAKMMGDLLAAVSGANAPTKQELTHSLGEVTPKVARDIMSEAFGDIGSGAVEETDQETVQPTLVDTDHDSDSEANS